MAQDGTDSQFGPVQDVPYNSLFACQLRVTVGDSGLCCFVPVTSFESKLNLLSVDSVQDHIIFALGKAHSVHPCAQTSPQH